MSKKHPKGQKSIPPAPKPQPAAWASIAQRFERFSVLAFVLLVAIGSARIVSTYTVFNHTADEGAHIACGMQWLSQGIYQFDQQHPPLARIAAAVGPYLAGRRSLHESDMYPEGAHILFGDGHYDRNVILARLGILPFFWISSLVVYLWAKRYFGEPQAFLAVFLFTFLPPILAHSGLATTDMALTAFTGAAFLAGLAWLENPNWRRSALFGATVALALLSKFTALAFIPVSFLAAFIFYALAERPGWASLAASARRRIVPFSLAAAVGFLAIWAGYRFSFGKFPAPEFFAGIRKILEHAGGGHQAYLLGNRGKSGWWYYFPVVLGVKTPLAFLALLGIGAVTCVKNWRGSPARPGRAWWLPLAFSLGIFLFSLTSHVDTGVRHILPIYMGFSIMAAVGAARLLDLAQVSKWAGLTLGALLLWLAASSALAHPDYIPYFNALAGGHPENIVVDSDLDWGQDMKRLSKRLHEAGATTLSFAPFLNDNGMPGFPQFRDNDPMAPDPGWNAVSLSQLKINRLGFGDDHPEIQPWPERVPPGELVGKTILLWYFPPKQ